MIFCTKLVGSFATERTLISKHTNPVCAGVVGRFFLITNLVVNDCDGGNRHIVCRMMNKLSMRERKLFYNKIDSESIKFLNFMVGRNVIKSLAWLHKRFY